MIPVRPFHCATIPAYRVQEGVGRSVMVDAKGPEVGGVRPARGRKYEKNKFKKSDIVPDRKGFTEL